MATYSSIFVWEILWTEDPGRWQVMGSGRVSHDLATKQQQQHTIVNSLVKQFVGIYYFRNILNHTMHIILHNAFVTVNITLISPCLYVHIIFKQLDWNLLYGFLLRVWTFLSIAIKCESKTLFIILF